MWRKHIKHTGATTLNNGSRRCDLGLTEKSNFICLRIFGASNVMSTKWHWMHRRYTIKNSKMPFSAAHNYWTPISTLMVHLVSHPFRREKVLEGKSRVSHSVHCPYFTDDKQEFWWVYIADRKNHALVTPPNTMTSLVDREEVELKFTAPQKPGK